MPDPVKMLAMVRRACMLFRATPGRRGAVIHLDNADDVLVAGDLHGNITTFKQILIMADLARHPKRHLVLQELVHGRSLFGGDCRAVADEILDDPRLAHLTDLSFGTLLRIA